MGYLKSAGKSLLLVFGLTALLSACGGGSDGVPTSSAAPVATAQQAVVVPSVAPVTKPAGAARLEERKARVNPRVPARSVVLSDPSRDRAAAATSATKSRGAVQVGFAREVSALANPSDLAAQLDWQPVAGGRLAAAISVSSPQAAGVRLGMLVRKLPVDAIVRVYAQNATLTNEFSGAEILLALQRNRDVDGPGAASDTYWLPMIEGPEATLEIELLAGSDPSQVEIGVPAVSHLYRSPTSVPSSGREQAQGVGTSGYCEVDVMCRTSDYAETGKSVAQMSYVSGGSSYVCTGTLINDSDSTTYVDYFLTAWHCISKQSEASSLQTYWFFRNAGCYSPAVLNSGAVQVSGGGVILYTTAAHDTTLLRLNRETPGGVTYAGWTNDSPVNGTAVTALHNPDGDLQKVSLGSMTDSLRTCNQTGDGIAHCNAVSSTAAGNAFDVTFNSGIIEGGSSGSPLFKAIRGTRYVTGLLSASNVSCQQPSSPATYMRFDVAYTAGLKNYLGGGDSAPPPPVARAPIYRFYNASTGAHFFTWLATISLAGALTRRNCYPS